MGFKEWVIRRTINSIILVILTVAFNFFLFRIPVFLFHQDPASTVLFQVHDPLTVELLRRAWGLPDPEEAARNPWIWMDYFWTYMLNTLTFNFGSSFQNFRDVRLEILDRLPNTLALMGISTGVGMAIGIVTGVLAASKIGSKTDVAIVTFSLSIGNIPIFWIGLLSLLIFGYYLQWFPLGGTVSINAPTDPVGRFMDYLWHLTLPAAVLTLYTYGGYMLLMRFNLINVLTEDYIVTARAKGVDNRTILYKHAMKNAFLPMITSITLSLALFWTGATLTETVFNWRGIGRYIFDAVTAQDWPVMQAVFYLIAISVVIATFIAEIFYGLLDPRIRYD